MEHAKEVFFETADMYDTHEDMKEYIRGLHSSGELTDAEYDTIIEEWDTWLEEWSDADADKTFELYFSDLTETAQAEVLRRARITSAEDANWDVFPIAVIKLGE